MQAITQHLLLLLCSLSLWGAKKAPEWVVTPPQSTMEYSGVGVVDKRHYDSQEAWESAAKTQALKNLSAAISMSISSNVAMQSHESTHALERSFTEVIGSFTTADLMGYTVGGVWETRTSYSIYYRLNKEHWKALEQERVRDKTAEALQYLEQGDRAQESRRPLEAIDAYIMAVRILQPVLYLNPQVAQGENHVPLVALLRDHLTTLLQEITITVTTPLFEGPRELYAKQPTPIRVSYKETPLPHFPLSLHEVTYLTDQEGHVYLPADSLSKALHHPLTITTAWHHFLLPQDSDKTLLTQWLTQQRWPRASTSLLFNQSTIAVTSQEQNLGIPRPGEDLALTTKNHLYRQGFHLAQEGQKARYTFIITASSRYISYANEIHVVELSIRWSVANSQGDVLYSEALKPLLAGAINGPQAGEDAYGRAKDVVADAITAWLVKNP